MLCEYHLFLADRTKGRTYATVLRPSVGCLWRYVLWLNGSSQCPRAKVTIDSLQEVAYAKSIGTQMNDLDLYLKVV